MPRSARASAVFLLAPLASACTRRVRAPVPVIMCVGGGGGRGEGAVGEARAQVSGSRAWVVVTYRFTKAGEQPERRRGTFLLEKRTAGWRIRHVHTSWVERWN